MNESTEPAGSDEHGPVEEMTGREVYNVVTDTVAGPNVRVRDNVFQAITIGVCILVGAGIGALVVSERLPGLLVGGFLGMIVGLLGSGMFLMVFRAIMHLQGRHK